MLKMLDKLLELQMELQLVITEEGKFSFSCSPLNSANFIELLCRQVAGAISSLSALAAITADPIVAQSNLTILFDSGVRTGDDVIKALALGAKAVLIGRPYIYGLAAGGQEGVEHVMKTLLAEVETTSALMGCSKTSELGRDRLTYVGSKSSLLQFQFTLLD